MEIEKEVFGIRGAADFSVEGKQPREKVKKIIDAMYTQGKPLQDAGVSYQDLATALEPSLKTIEDAAKRMAECWGDKGSVEAQKALQSLYKTIYSVIQSAKQMGPPLEHLGRNILPDAHDYGDWADGDDGAFGTGIFSGSWNDDLGGITGWTTESENDGAKKAMQGFSEQMQTTFDSLPQSVTKELFKDPPGSGLPPTPPFEMPDTGGVTPSSFNPNVGSMPNFGDGKVGDIPTVDKPDLPGYNDPSGNLPGSNRPDGNLPGGPGGSDGSGGNGKTPDLPKTPDTSGIDPGAATSPSMPTTDPTKGLDPNGNDTKLADFQPSPFNNPVTSPTIPTTTPGTPYGTPVTGVSTGIGAGGSLGGPAGMPGTGAGMPGTNGMGMPMMPMMGGGGHGGEEERDRESSTWLLEDEDVWGNNVEGVVDDRIG